MPISATPKDGPDWTNLATIIRQNGTVLTLGSRIDHLLTVRATAGVSYVAVVTVTATLVKTDYSELYVLWTDPAGNYPPACVTASGSLPSTLPLPYRVAPFGSAPGATRNVMAAILPMPLSRGKAFKLYLRFTMLTASGNVAVYAATGLSGVQMRSDGRTYPIGSHGGHGAGVSGYIVVAPTSPLRIFVSSLSGGAHNATAGVRSRIFGTIDGVTTWLYNGGAAAGDWTPPPPPLPAHGVLLDPGTALSFVATGTPTNQDFFATYDLVV